MSARRWGIVGTAAVLAMAAACGSSHNAPTDSPSKRDAAVTPDTPVTKMDASVYDFECDDSSPCSTSMVCCTQPNQTPPFACLAPASCPTSDQITCAGPADCAAAPSTPICCGTDVPDGTGEYPNCGITSIGTTCVAATACPTALPSTCAATTMVTLCHVAGDCMDSSYPDCCTFKSGSASLTFCVDSQLAAFGTCHT
jgi:hypothetical protein